jgi:hypothetical protein
VDPETLIEDLAQVMAASIVESLVKESIEQPIALLELNYHYADVYVPLLAWKSVREVSAQLADQSFSFLDFDYSGPQPETLPFERLFAQLEQMMAEKSNMELGRIMLIKAAYPLTRSKLFGKIKVNDDFIAFAIDWSIEGHSNEQFEEILLECGAELNVLENWKQKGMLPLHQDPDS